MILSGPTPAAEWFCFGRQPTRAKPPAHRDPNAFCPTMETKMRAVVQRVSESRVVVENRVIAEIGQGLLVLLGIAKGDEPRDADYLADKITNLRIFEDESGKMNRSLRDIEAELLVVSQFTLLGDCRKGRRPSFIDAAEPEVADRLYEYFIEKVRQKGIFVQTGRFRAMMEVALINSGPVTLVLDSKGPMV